ncbi:MAG: cystathionine beta-lyase [Beijerinckiaceae bacterium]
MSKLSDTTRKGLKPRTKLVYAGREPADQHGFVNAPIYRGSTVLSPTVEHLYAREGYVYGTKGNPTLRALETAWTELSGAAGTILCGSGLSAIATAFLAVVKSGDDILVTDTAYRPTRILCDGLLKRMGVTTRYYDPAIGAGIAALIQSSTTLIYAEAPGSQSFEMQDIPAISAAAHAAGHEICVVIDNTWATPLLFPPHERGADMAIEAGTKYLSGHSDLLLGLVSANERWFPRLREAFDATAPCAGPEDVFLALRGLRTMELRLREAEKQALLMARWFQARPEVLRVLHPALPGDPGHSIWKRDFSGSSGLFSVVLKPASDKAVAAMLDGLELFGMGYSWAGFESLVIPFDCSTYRTATQWNPGGPTLRFQIGLEDVGDLQADLAKGFERLRAG